MESFSADWLALREPADHAARAATLTSAIAAHLATRPGARAVDLAAGTGSNVRYLLPRLPAIHHWTLVDHDAALLARAWRLLGPLAAGAGRSFDVRAGDLMALDSVSLEGSTLVTAAALLDLVSEAWLRDLAGRCATAGVAVLFALSYDGRLACDPPDADDELVRELVNQHQRGDKGFGLALGPEAPRAAAACFTAAGFTVTRAESEWTLGPDVAELQQQLVDGWASAAADLAPERAARIAAWRDRRVAHIAAGRSHLRVGHEDLAGLPPGR